MMAQGSHQEPPCHQHKPFTSTTTVATVWPGQQHRGRVRLLLRKRKMKTVRLGGDGGGKNKAPAKRRVLGGLVRILRRMKLRWLKLQYVRMLKRLKEHYRSIVKDLIEAGASVETFQQRLFMETSFAIPIGVSLSAYPSHFGSDCPRTIFM
ncbi:Lox2p [Stylosanthes scabra]|uniref:Lox2p n=1 Tax=Stylosanthes scabra TaxID=79078 RepID=A0ABU6Y510_9FABA|nr:Lox2p [Stylosanthes scabra]